MPEAGGRRPAPELSLVFSDPRGHPIVYTIPDGTTTLGSAKDNDVVLEHEGVQPHQIVLQRDGDLLELRDLFAGETKVNDEVRRNGPVKPGDVITLGDLRLRVMKVAPSRQLKRPGGAKPRTRRLTGRRARDPKVDVGADPPTRAEPSTRARRSTERGSRSASPSGSGAVEETVDGRLAREQDARRARALARARQVADEIMPQDDFEVILELLATGFLDVFSADRAVTVLFEEDGRNPLLVVERRRDGTAEGAGVAQEIIDRCLQVRGVIRVAGGYEGLGGLAAPLITQGRALGLLYFERTVAAAGYAMGADDVHLLALLTNVASLKIAPLVM